LPNSAHGKPAQKKITHCVNLTRFTQTVLEKSAELPTKQPFLTDGTPIAEIGTNGVDSLG
jgi:hypothetical protein